MGKTVQIAIVATDNPLYKNAYINNLVKECKENIGLIVELNFKHPSSNTKVHYSRYFNLLGLKGFLYVAALKVRQLVMITFSTLFSMEDGYNLHQIAKKNGVGFQRINSVNSDEFIQLLQEYKIDFIINSGNQIYKQKILSQYENKILNRHSSFLPKYGGIYPIFWQMINEEKKGGVSLHWIDKYIDKGRIAYQEQFDIQLSKSLFWHYKMAFDISLKLSIRAINDLKQGKISSIEMGEDHSYVSWPDKADIKKFKKNNLRIV